jgi:beta-glucanase (GH16 family)
MRTRSPLVSQPRQLAPRAFCLVGLATTLLAICGLKLSPGFGHEDKAPAITDAWELVWSDEFDFPDGARIDPSKWTAEIGGEGWGNREKQYYTDRRENATIENGCLVIRAIKENLEGSRCWYGPCEFTSARITTQAKFQSTYGRFEARIQIPSGQGIWPAFWMLGSDVIEVRWPACGEIDIMENIGKEPSTVHGTIHGPGYSGSAGIGAKYSLPKGQRFDGDFHVFAVEWEPNVIRWYVDDNLYQTRTPKDLPARKEWVYHHPFFVLLNVAVGGNWPGNPDTTTVLPQTMRVDYVRVYQRPRTKENSP